MIMRHHFHFGIVSCAAVIALALGVCPLRAQTLLTGVTLGGQVSIFPTDAAVLEIGEGRTDLPCKVRSVGPVLGFDMRFHAGYVARVPLNELAGEEDLLTVIFRVRPQGQPDNPYYFTQHVDVPSLEEDSEGEALVQGVFDLGQGEYRVDWLMRDRSARVCSSYWGLKADLPRSDEVIALTVAPNSVLASETEIFQAEPPVARAHEEPLRLKILVNYAPQDSGAPIMQPLDTQGLTSILRGIVREPRFAKFSVVAFNVQEQRILYRQDDADYIDFHSLGQALDSLKLGTVDLERLSKEHGEADFLRDLIRQETSSPAQLNALVFTSPKVMLEEDITEAALEPLGRPDYPVFYLNYNLYPRARPFRDTIGRVVRFFEGYEYTISRPDDLWQAVSEMASRIVSFRQEQGALRPSHQ